MSRTALRLLLIPSGLAFALACSSAAMAQETYGPVLEEPEADSAPPLTETTPRTRQCDTAPSGDDVILVCRELEDDEAYRSPLPAPTASDRTIIPGLTDPPCWVTNPSALGTPGCMRFGFVPPPAIIVDLTQFPEPLDPEDAAAVSAVKEEPAEPSPQTGERVPIDLTDEQ